MINFLKNIVLAATNTNISGGPGSLIEAPISFAITKVLCQVSTTLVPTIALSSFQRALRQFHAVESMFHDYNCTMSELSSMLIVNTLYGFQVSELNHTRLEAPSRVPLPSFQLIYKHYVSSCIWLSTFILIG